jgi:hypothetical protein
VKHNLIRTGIEHLHRVGRATAAAGGDADAWAGWGGG